MEELDIISDVLTHIGNKYPNINAIQIGASDGATYDDVRPFFDKYDWNLIAVEPIPYLFEELKNNTADRKNTKYENSAITSEEGVVSMLTVPEEAFLDTNLHAGYKGMSSIYPPRNGFGSNYKRDIEVKEKYGKLIEVPGITFETLLNKHGFKNVDVLICDAEGYDWEILKQVDFSKYDLKFIRVEYINLTKEEKTLLRNKLDEANYVYDLAEIEDHQLDLDAVKVDILQDIYGLNTDMHRIRENLEAIKQGLNTIQTRYRPGIV